MTQNRTLIIALMLASICSFALLFTLSVTGKTMHADISVFPKQLYQASELENWRVVNDTVMGGVSSSSVSATAEGMLFSGQLSLDNNGGFASVRRFGEAILLKDAHRLNLTVKGDGRTYQLRLRTRWEFNSVAYAASFDTQPDEVITVTFVTEDFAPVWRGRLVRGAPKLSFKDVLQPGFMLADKTPGPFALEVLSLNQ